MTDAQPLPSRITANPMILLGKPTVRGMRITVEQLLRALSAGISEDAPLDEYPELEEEDFPAIFADAIARVEEKRVSLSDLPA